MTTATAIKLTPRPAITFREADHTYWDGAIEVPGVSKLMEAGGIAPDLSRVEPAVLEHARQRGQYAEVCCRAYDEGDLDEAALPDEIRPYVEGWKQLVTQHAITVLGHQQILYHPTLGYAGTLDVDVLYRGARGVLDIKCTAKKSPTWRVQVLGYSQPGLLMVDGDTMVERPLITHRLVAWLRKDGPSELIDLKAWAEQKGANDLGMFLDCLEAYRRQQRAAEWKARG